MIYFPAPYPDEVGGSLLVRACRHLGLSFKALLAQVVGQRGQTSCALLLTSHLPRVARLAGIDAEDLLWGHTIFGYVTAFQPPHATRHFRDLLLLRPHESPLKAGVLARSGIDNAPFRRFCPSCLEQDRMKYGEAYWHRSHFLPAVYVCPQHGDRLLMTDIPILRPKAAGFYTLPGEIGGRRIQCGASPNILRAIAARSVALCGADSPRKADWIGGYRDLAIRKGYVLKTKDRIVAGRQLSRDLLTYYSPTLLASAGAPVPVNKDNPWPSLIVRGLENCPFIPVKHLLIAHFLEQCAPGTKIIDYRPPGPHPKDSEAADEALSFQLRRLLAELGVHGHKYTEKKVMMQIGAWSAFRHDRKCFPRTAALIADFLCSDLSERRYKTPPALRI